MTLNSVMAIIVRYFAELGSSESQLRHSGQLSCYKICKCVKDLQSSGTEEHRTPSRVPRRWPVCQTCRPLCGCWNLFRAHPVLLGAAGQCFVDPTQCIQCRMPCMLLTKHVLFYRRLLVCVYVCMCPSAPKNWKTTGKKLCNVMLFPK